MTLNHRLRGYDKQKRTVAYDMPIPAEAVPATKRILNDPSDPDLLMVHPLNRTQIHKLALVLAHPIDADEYDYVIDCWADWDTIKRAKRRAGVLT